MSSETPAVHEDGEIRKKLLAEATALFVRKGYAGTSVREVVAAAGVTPPVLYYYFGNKEGLYLEILRDATGQFEAMMRDALAQPGTAREKLTTLTLRCCALLRQHLDVARLIYARDYGPPQGEPSFDSHSMHDTFREAFRALIASGVAAGEFAPGNLEGKLWSILGVVNIAMEVQLCHCEIPFSDDTLQEALAVVFRGFGCAEA